MQDTNMLHLGLSVRCFSCPRRYRAHTCTNYVQDHINTYVHPQAIIVDGSKNEEDPFLRGVRQQADEIKSAIIELPEHTGKRLNWITKLDSASLSGTIPPHRNPLS